MYGVPPERVIGSSVGLDFVDGQLKTTATPEFLNDGPVKAGADLGTRRAAADLRGGQLQRRYPDARSTPAAGQDRRWVCWCVTTTPNANSITPQARIPR